MEGYMQRSTCASDRHKRHCSLCYNLPSLLIELKQTRQKVYCNVGLYKLIGNRDVYNSTGTAYIMFPRVEAIYMEISELKLILLLEFMSHKLDR